MANEAQKIYLIRHGETEWSRGGKHTGVTDVSLTEQGRKIARLLQPVLARENFVVVLSSPLQRARETCELAGLGKVAVIEPDLVEWNYGEYEGLTTKQIQSARPGWSVFHHGCPGGEITGASRRPRRSRARQSARHRWQRSVVRAWPYPQGHRGAVDRSAAKFRRTLVARHGDVKCARLLLRHSSA